MSEESWFDSWQGQTIFLFYKVFRPSQDPTKPFVFNGYRKVFPGLKRPWREADHSPPPPSSAGVKNECSYIPTPLCLHGCIVTAKEKVVVWDVVATLSGAHPFAGFLLAVLNLRARYQRAISYATCVVISRLSGRMVRSCEGDVATVC